MTDADKSWGFLSVFPKNKCIEFAGHRDRTGYGKMTFGGRADGAHRVAFSLFVWPLKQGKIVCHSCDNPSCVNPRHLWAGSYSDNMYDAVRKGRLVSPFKKRCKRGHEFTEENTAYYETGSRRCRKCRRIIWKRHAKKKKVQQK